ncbi:hypothetical protein GBA63_22395 (plasmid) [Rubrobacter tropicus]|uniref:Uncharacterized protein n=1 Tax=Rubrobacter tropicus TaxID=2653851 RepID=A0A6G8QG28_9ACTN|nr:hypothetical protein [Rubrobacter tropicus]QIN85454.1 hypothetical protein GBA63_22395 [Rubrobacter tropicus]
MKADAVTLFHGLIIDPVEDSSSDNLSGLAELLSLREDAGLDVRLGTFPSGRFSPDAPPATVLQLEASGSVEDVAPVARSAAAFAIFPDIGVPSPSVGARTHQLLEGTVGVLVRPLDELRLSGRTLPERPASPAGG